MPPHPPDLLEKVLRDLTPEQRARVLELVVRLDLDTDDPLWLVALAIGQLQVLVEDAPDDWQTLFKGFQGDLTTWTNTHLHTLEVVADKAKVTANLAEYTQELSSILKTLVTACNVLIERLQASELTSMDSRTQFKHSMSRVEHSLEEIKASQKRHLSQTQESLANLAPPRHQAATLGGIDAVVKIAALLSGLNLLAFLWLLGQTG